MKNGPYILIVAPCNYPGKKYRGRYAYEHQIVWWSNTASLVPKGYSIHHKNDDKHDNNFTNLELISNSTHGKIHARKKQNPVPLACGYCGKMFLHDKRNYNYKIKIGQKIFYCCRSHQVIEQQRMLKISRIAQLVESV